LNEKIKLCEINNDYFCLSVEVYKIPFRLGTQVLQVLGTDLKGSTWIQFLGIVPCQKKNLIILYDNNNNMFLYIAAPYFSARFTIMLKSKYVNVSRFK
jgi:hypothetical protein